MRKNVNIIVGSMRSGTTIIHRSLCQGLNTNPYISESWFLLDLLRLYKWGLARYEIRYSDQFGAKSNFESLIYLNVEFYLSSISVKYEDPDILFLKHPEISYYVNELSEMFLSFKFIVIVRDPRDVIASIHKVRQRHLKSNINSPQTKVDSIEAHCRNYFRYYDNILKNINALRKKIIFIKYEDFILNTKKEIDRISIFSGAEYNIEQVINPKNFETKSLNFDKGKRLNDPLGAGFWSEDYLEPLTGKNIGNFKDILSKEEIDCIEKNLNNFGVHFKYW